MLADGDVGDEHVGHVLNGAMVAAVKPLAVFVRAKKHPGLIE